VEVTGVVTDQRPTGWIVDVRYRSRDGVPVGIQVPSSLTKHDLPLWFVAVHDSSRELSATSLLAFQGAGITAGQVVPPHEAAARGVRQPDCVGEIRWSPRSGIVDTVRVDRAAQRRGVGRHLVTAAEGLRVLWGWPPLRSDGRLNDAGARWLDGSPPCWQTRLSARTERLPEVATTRSEPRGVARLLS
jgi:GNAT superfamily N-acetyltransferase